MPVVVYQNGMYFHEQGSRWKNKVGRDKAWTTDLQTATVYKNESSARRSRAMDVITEEWEYQGRLVYVPDNYTVDDLEIVEIKLEVKE